MVSQPTVSSFSSRFSCRKGRYSRSLGASAVSDGWVSSVVSVRVTGSVSLGSVALGGAVVTASIMGSPGFSGVERTRKITTARFTHSTVSRTASRITTGEGPELRACL